MAGEKKHEKRPKARTGFLTRIVLLLLLVATRVLGAPLSSAVSWGIGRLFFLAEWGARIAGGLV